MDRLEIRNLIRKGLGETTSAFWTDTELNGYINNSGHDVAERSKCIKTSGYMTAIEDQYEYTATSYFPLIISMTELYFYQDGEAWHKLTSINRTDKDILFPGWMSAESGTPTHYTYDQEEDKLTFYVPPDDENVEASGVKIFYSQDFTDLTLDSATPAGIPFSLQLAMVDYAIATGYQHRGWNEKANDAWSKYFSRIGTYVAERHREKEDETVIMKNYRNL